MDMMNSYDALFETNSSELSEGCPRSASKGGINFKTCSQRLQPRTLPYYTSTSVITTNINSLTNSNYSACMSNLNSGYCIFKTAAPSRPHMSSSLFSGSKFQEGIISGNQESKPRGRDLLNDAPGQDAGTISNDQRIKRNRLAVPPGFESMARNLNMEQNHIGEKGKEILEQQRKDQSQQENWLEEQKKLLNKQREKQLLEEKKVRSNQDESTTRTGKIIDLTKTDTDLRKGKTRAD